MAHDAYIGRSLGNVRYDKKVGHFELGKAVTEMFSGSRPGIGAATITRSSP